VDESEFREPVKVKFRDFADQWLDSLERKPTTRESYRSSMEYAKRAFGEKQVRRIRTDDIVRLSRLLRDEGMSDSTRAKHLRVVGVALNSAIRHGLAARNPVSELPKGERPRPRRRESAYFESAELPRLFAEIPDGVYRVLFEVALKTGMRLGELAGLVWGDVDLQEGAIHVRRAYTHGALTTPKSHEKRDVDVTPDVVTLLGRWWGELGRPGDNTLVFPGPTADGYLSNEAVLRRVLYPAMKRAGIPREGPTGEPRTFHSLRHTYAKLAIENGRQLTWLQRHLGHSSLNVTVGIYGHFEKAARKREAAAMEGVFGV
jgi:integrase